ncbi:MAG: hypothetical protein IPO17_11170 [Flavobacteriales bacterium]|nr:hypothetical protein [Flavobacteriales bacterium]
MGRTFEHFWEGIYHGAIEALTLLLLLLAVLTVWGWLNNRRFKPSERGGIIPWMLVLFAFALVLVLRAFDGPWPLAIAICVAVLVAGFMGRVVKEKDLWLPAILLAALIGMDYMLSALVLAFFGGLVLLLTARR